MLKRVLPLPRSHSLVPNPAFPSRCGRTGVALLATLSLFDGGSRSGVVTLIQRLGPPAPGAWPTRFPAVVQADRGLQEGGRLAHAAVLGPQHGRRLDLGERLRRQGRIVRLDHRERVATVGVARRCVAASALALVTRAIPAIVGAGGAFIAILAARGALPAGLAVSRLKVAGGRVASWDVAGLEVTRLAFTPLALAPLTVARRPLGARVKAPGVAAGVAIALGLAPRFKRLGSRGVAASLEPIVPAIRAAFIAILPIPIRPVSVLPIPIRRPIPVRSGVASVGPIISAGRLLDFRRGVAGLLEPFALVLEVYI